MRGMAFVTYGRFIDIKTTAAVASTAGDHFKDEIVSATFRFFYPSPLTGQQVPKEYLNKEHVDLRRKTVYGVNACTAEAYDPFRGSD